MKKQPFTEVNPANQCPLLTFLFKTGPRGPVHRGLAPAGPKGLFAEITSGKASFNLLGKPIFIDVLIPGPRRIPGTPGGFPPPCAS